MARATLPPPGTRRDRAAPAAGPPPERPGAPPPRRHRTGGRERRERRVWWGALLASAAFHVLVLLLVRFTPGFRPVPAGPVPAEEVESGLRLLRIETVPGDVEELARPEEPEVAAPAPARRPAPPAPPPPADAEPADRLTAVDRLRPGAVRDPRLWRDHGPIYHLPPETPEEAILRGLLPRLALLNDSIALEADRRRRATDWTFTDSEGRRWGISPEGIHLGGITLPEMDFSPSEEMRLQVEAALREWSEIRDQAYRAGLDESFEERVRAIRERVERERAERRDGGGGR